MIAGETDAHCCLLPCGFPHPKEVIRPRVQALRRERNALLFRVSSDLEEVISMEITVTGRHTDVAPRFQRHIEEKLAKVPQLDPRMVRADVVVTHENNPRRAKEAYRIEITCHGRRAVIRAEAAADEEYAALDVVMSKLAERLRRQHDRRRVTRGHARPISVAEATADLPVLEVMPNTGGSEQHTTPALGEDPDCPVQLREKTHTSPPMALDEALREMELVGHDFYLYFDKDAGQPSLVYRRRGWSYGVLHLNVSEDAADSTAEADGASA